jgi:hypothetical protein
MKTILLAGEGRNELGGWYDEPSFRLSPPDLGILEALLKKVAPQGWSIVDGVRWKSLRKYKVNEPGKAEEKNLRRLLLMAEERQCNLVAFTRDRDRSRERQAQIDSTMAEMEAQYTEGPFFIGGMAIEKIEAWLLALSGETRSESIGDPAAKLAPILPESTTSEMARLVMRAEITSIPRDANSLSTWIQKASRFLNTDENK